MILLICLSLTAVSLLQGAAENPTLTIVSLAIRQAEHIAKEMSKGNNLINFN